MAGVVFYGSGAVYVPDKNYFIRFKDGKYETVHADEIRLLAKKYPHDGVEPKQEQIAFETVEEKPRRGRKPNAERNS